MQVVVRYASGDKMKLFLSDSRVLIEKLKSQCVVAKQVREKYAKLYEQLSNMYIRKAKAWDAPDFSESAAGGEEAWQIGFTARLASVQPAARQEEPGEEYEYAVTTSSLRASILI